MCPRDGGAECVEAGKTTACDGGALAVAHAVAARRPEIVESERILDISAPESGGSEPIYGWTVPAITPPITLAQ